MAKAMQLDMVFLADKIDLAQGKKRLAEAIRGLQRRGLQRIADAVAEKAAMKAPEQTGCLKSSIRGKVRKARGRDELMATVSSNTKGKIKTVSKMRYENGVLKTRTYETKVNYGYGLDVEIGRPGGNYSSTPYLRPALLESVGEIKEILREEYARQAAASKAGAAAGAVGSYRLGGVDIPVFDQEVLIGKKGGRYYLTESGKRVYLK